MKKPPIRTFPNTMRKPNNRKSPTSIACCATALWSSHVTGVHNAPSGIKRLDHHIDLSLISHEQSAGAECRVDGIHDPVEAAGCALLLDESGNAELVPFAVLNDCHQLDSKRHLLEIEICRKSVMSNVNRREHGELTVLRSHASENDVALLVNLNISDTVFAPLAKQDGNLLSGAALEDVEAEMAHRRFDAEETSQPVLLHLNLSSTKVAV